MKRPFPLLLGLLFAATAYAKAPRIEVRFDGATLTPYANTGDLIDGIVSTLRDDHGTVTIRGYVDSTNKTPGLDYLFEQRARLVEGLLGEWLAENTGWKFGPAILSDNFSEHSRSFQGGDDDLMVVEVEFREAHTEVAKLRIKPSPGASPYDPLGKVSIQYAPTSTRLYPGGQQEILAAMGMHRKAKLYVKVMGYAHREGKSEKALKLSKTRAAEVVQFLQGLGLPRDRFLVVTGLEDRTGNGGPQSRRVEVEFLTQREFDEAREPADEPAPIAAPCPPRGGEKEPEEKTWFGTFGLADSFDYYNFLVSLEHAVGPNMSVGVGFQGLSSTRAGYAGRAHGLAAGLSVNFYSRPNWTGIWIRIAALYHMTTSNDLGTMPVYLPGLRFNMGYVLNPDFPFRVRLSAGFQQISEGNFNNVFGGFSPILQIELGLPW